MRNLINARATYIESLLISEKNNIDELRLNIISNDALQICFMVAIFSINGYSYKLISKHYTNEIYLVTICEKIKSHFNNL